MFKNKTLLITGGTGSFGNAILHRFMYSNLKEIRIFSRDEKKQEDMRILHNNPNIKFHIGDVRDIESVRNAIKDVDYVFHAAALKQVPSCEFYPMQAIQTNILGTENVMNAAIEACVEKVVVLSTDKAVYPINAMGISKAMMEKIMVAKSRMQKQGETIFCATRYGNVMGSRGSVIPLFINQIKSNKALTVTEPSMTRFLMSLEESIDLVIHAFINAKQGDIFVQKAVSSTISDLAKSLQILFNVKSEVHVIGARHGEKLFETLVSREEMSKAEISENYFRIPADNRDLNYSSYFTVGELLVSNYEDYTSHNTKLLPINDIVSMLSSLEFIKKELT